MTRCERERKCRPNSRLGPIAYKDIKDFVDKFAKADGLTLGEKQQRLVVGMQLLVQNEQRLATQQKFQIELGGKGIANTCTAGADRYRVESAEHRPQRRIRRLDANAGDQRKPAANARRLSGQAFRSFSSRSKAVCRT